MSPLHRVYNLATVALFGAAICLPCAAYLGKIDTEVAAGENRTLHAMPAVPVTTEQMLAWPRGVDAFWNDQFGFRPRLIQWNALLKLRTGVSASPLVVVGKRGRLFYTGNSSMEAFSGRVPFSPNELRLIKDELEARQAWLGSKGIKYLFTIAPNKESLYSEDVPDDIAYAQPHRLDQLIDYLKAHSTLQLLDLRPALRTHKEKDSEQLFHKTDTHWTDVGAFAGYEPIRDVLKSWFPGYRGRTWSEVKRVKGPPFSGDLSAMLGLVGYLSDDRVELLPNPPWQARELTHHGYAKGGPRIARWRGRPDGPRLVLFHDSFFLEPQHRDAPVEAHVSPFEMVPLIAEEFSYAYSQWRPDFAPDVIERENPDVVIQEIVERLLINGIQGAAPK